MSKKKHQQLQNIWDIAGAPFTPDDIDLEKAYKRVMNHVKPPGWYQSPFCVFWQRASAILLIPVISGLIYFLIIGSDKERTSANRRPVLLEVSASYGTHTKMNLPDGSTVWLNGGSLLKYPAVFAPGTRTVCLSGEAYFEVESDANNPFIVATKDLEIQATGTAFNVEAYRGDSLVTVTMANGEVAVRIENALPIAMEPGDRMEYNLRKKQYEIQKTDAYKWYAWKDGLIVFRDDPLGYVFKKIGQTFNVEIEVKDASISQHLYRATFEDESLDEILRLLSMTAPIRYKFFDRMKDTNSYYLKQRIEVYRY
jgi:ferric-dicitrate binding protein FerR (iron transport regulator)